jgi:uncharacterized protein
MSMWNQGRWGGNTGDLPAFDPSLAGSPAIITFFNAVYGWMAAGLALTALTAYLVASNIQSFGAALTGPMVIGLFVAQIILVMAISGAVHRINANVATVMFLLYSALNGVTLSGLFLVYANVTLGGAFLVTAVTFASVSLYGMVTQRDLSGFGSMFMMLLIGLVVASVVNLFFASSGLYWLVTYGGVLLFVALTAYDTQRLKVLAMQTAGDPAMAARFSVVGALRLYLDFINLLLLLLRILGNANGRRR